MMRARALLGLGLVTALAALPKPASAWNSKCRRYIDNTLDGSVLATQAGIECIEAGPVSAQGRYRSDDGQDEHAAIFRRAVSLAGIPAGVLATQRLTVFAFDKPAHSDPATYAGKLKSIAPVSFTNTNVLRKRAFAIDELAMLPDFSYSLWDWATGNESCPLTGYELDGTINCHTFESHMGMANANHFPPLADKTFDYLHKLAIDRAKECAAVRAKVPAADRGRFKHLFAECEIESLAIEAVAQHYLQDIWSTGHMWERWGASDVERYPDPGDSFFLGTTTALDRRRFTARVVGAVSGTIHGSEGLLGIDDAMCFPQAQIKFMSALSSTPIRGAGDLHFQDKLQSDSAFLDHDVKMLGCAAASVHEVYSALGTDPTFGKATGTPVTKLSDCFGQRATNAAFERGIGLDIDDVHVPLQVMLASGGVTAFSLEAIAAGWKMDLSPTGTAKLNYDLSELSFVAGLRALDAPNATDASTLNVTFGGVTAQPTMMLAERNSAYLTTPTLAKYQDPTLPWPATTDAVTPSASTRAQSLAQLFHRAHAADYCSMSAPALDTLKLNVAGATTGAERDAKCAVCTEVVSRHLRVGTGPTAYDTKAEPFCSYHATSATGYAYQGAGYGSSTPSVLARKWCGCGGAFVALTDAGWYDVDALSGAVTVGSKPMIPTTPAGTQPRDIAFTDDGRAIVTHSDGTLVVVDVANRREVDTDDDATTTTSGAPTGVSRLKPSAGARGVALTTLGGKSYVLVVSPPTDEVVVIDVSPGGKTYPLCKRFDVGRDGTKNEDAWDIVVMPDQKKAYVSFRGTVSAPSDTLAVLDLAKATDCATPGGEVSKHLFGIFGAKAGIGAMALNPTATRLALTARRSGMCTATVRTSKFGTGTTTMGVGCDSVILLDPASDTVVSVPTSTGFFGTLPTFYPFALAWVPDGSKLAYASFLGPDPWPQYFGVESVGAGGAVRLGNPSAGQSYNVALKGSVIGETLIAQSDYIYVGTMSGDITAMPNTTDFWENRKADPEISLHGSAWYGGCHDGTTGVPSPVACTPALNLGSPIRVMVEQ